MPGVELDLAVFPYLLLVWFIQVEIGRWLGWLNNVFYVSEFFLQCHAMCPRTRVDIIRRAFQLTTPFVVEQILSEAEGIYYERSSFFFTISFLQLLSHSALRMDFSLVLKTSESSISV